jgi:uncharacterized metal-binding protein
VDRTAETVYQRDAISAIVSAIYAAHTMQLEIGLKNGSALLSLVLACSGCSVVSLAGTAVSTTVSVAGSAISAGASVAASAVKAAANVASTSSDKN